MPDRDVFDRNVARGWQTASRRMLVNPDDPNALASAVRALADKIKKNGWPGFIDLVDRLVEAATSGGVSVDRPQLLEQLDEIRQIHCTTSTQLTVEAAKSIIAEDCESASTKPTSMSGDELRMRYAIRLLARYADNWMCPARLLGELVEQGSFSYQSIPDRRGAIRKAIEGSLKTRQIAHQLLSDPSGAMVRIPRFSRTKNAQEVLLVLEIA